MTEKCEKCINFVERHCDNDASITDEFSMIIDTFEVFEERIEKLEEKIRYLEEAVEIELNSYQHHIAELEDEKM